MQIRKGRKSFCRKDAAELKSGRSDGVTFGRDNFDESVTTAGSTLSL